MRWSSSCFESSSHWSSIRGARHTRGRSFAPSFAGGSRRRSPSLLRPRLPRGTRNSRSAARPRSRREQPESQRNPYSDGSRVRQHADIHIGSCVWCDDVARATVREASCIRLTASTRPRRWRAVAGPVDLSRRRRTKSSLRQGDGDAVSDFALLVEDCRRPGCDSIVTAMTLRSQPNHWPLR